MNGEIKNVVLYLRYSSAAQNEQSIEGQRHVCQEYCRRAGYQIIDEYVDRATSASHNVEKRFNFQRMLRDAERGRFDAVVVYKLDRFARNRYDSVNAKYRLKKAGVVLLSATENLSDSPESIILESVLEGMAEFYSAELSQKITRGMKETAQKHLSTGGTVPLGYRIENRRLVIDPTTAPIVKQAFEMYAAGHTATAIAKQFNASGYRTSKGTAFNRSSFKSMFHNERYIGTYKYGAYKAENTVPAIIDKQLWDAVQSRLSRPVPPSQGKAQVPFLLAGKLFCGHCGAKMNGDSGKGRSGEPYYYYTCYNHKRGHTCNKKSVRKEWIEKVVVQDAMQLLTDDYIEELADIAVQENQRQIAATTKIPLLKEKIAETEKSINNIVTAIEKGVASDTLMHRITGLEQQKKDYESQLAAEETSAIQLDKYMVIYWLDQFKHGDVDDERFRRNLINLLVNSVTIWDDPDGGFRITTAYNLTDAPTKTFRVEALPGSDMGSSSPPQRPDRVFCQVFFVAHNSLHRRKTCLQREIFKKHLQFAPGCGTILRQYTRIALFFCAFFAVTRQKG